MLSFKQQVKQYVLDNFIMGASPEDLGDGDSFMERHIIDSTGIIELVSFLEDAFGIRIAEEEMVPDNLDSLDNIERYLQSKLSGTGT
jgi:acyl carrier protein